jgi:hypothetical protein
VRFLSYDDERVREAEELFEWLLELCNDVGLLSGLVPVMIKLDHSKAQS